MAAISAALVRELRDKTGAGMMDCKAALAETGGDVEAATDWLRKKGVAAAAKKSGRATSEGLIGVVVDGGVGAVVEVNSETDFVSRNETFQELVRAIAAVAPQAGGDVEALRALTLPTTGRSVADSITDAVAVIGENLTLRRTGVLAIEPGLVVSYVHGAVAANLGRIGVLVALRSEADPARLMETGRQLAMHVAAAQPQAVTAADLPADAVERERSIYAEQATASGKPPNIVEKMVEGRMRKFYEEAVLMEQAFVVDPERKVKDVVAALASDVGAPVTVAGFLRFALGEGIDKPVPDLASEVASTLAGR
jgi:elongation factor Ts